MGDWKIIRISWRSSVGPDLGERRGFDLSFSVEFGLESESELGWDFRPEPKRKLVIDSGIEVEVAFVDAGAGMFDEEEESVDFESIESIIACTWGFDLAICPLNTPFPFPFPRLSFSSPFFSPPTPVSSL